MCLLCLCIARVQWPYTGFRVAEATLAAASERQRRLLGEHPISNYG